MKKLFVSTLFVALYFSANANSENLKATADSKEIGKQLSSFIVVPEVLKNSNKNGVVVVEFFVSNNSIDRVKVFTSDEQLNASLIRQLTGKKINTLSQNSSEKHTVKLRFRMDE